MSNIQSAAESYDFEFREPEGGFSLDPAGPPTDNDEAERLNREQVFNHDDDVFLVAWEDAVPANDAATPAVPEYASRYLEVHVKYLLARAISLSVAWAEGVRSLQDHGVKLHTGCTVTGTGLGFGYGRVSDPYTRVQLDDRVGNEGKTRAPAGVTPPPYIPTTVTESTTEPLFIVEAPAKALSMVSNGFPNTIGCGGVNAGFFAKGSSKVQRDLRPFLHKTRPVYIVFDAGRSTNVLVAKAEAKITRALLDGGAPTFVVELPPGPDGADQGPDDFLAANGPGEMATLIKRACPASPSEWARLKSQEGAGAARALLKHLPFIAALDAAGPGELGAVAKVLKDVTDKTSLQALCRTFQKAAKAKAQQATATSATEVLKVGDHVEVARRYLKTLGEHVVFTEGLTHAYEDGVWKPLDAGQQMGAVANYSGAPVVTNNGVKPLALDARDLDGIVTVAGHLTSKPTFFADAPSGLAFNNGFLRLEASGAHLVEHSPDNRARFSYDAEYEPNAPCTQWDALLSELWDGDPDASEKVACLQEFFGASLFGVAPRFKKCILMTGDTDSGKSTCLHIMRGAFPPGTTEAIAPGDWTSDYKRASLAGKLLNTVAELPEKEWIETESFKAFVGDDPINARQIYGVPFTYFSRAGHIFAANTLPRISDRSDATWNRMLVLTCNQRFHRNPAPGQKQATEGLVRRILDSEKLGILAWAVRGLERLLARGRYTEPPSSGAAVAKWKTLSDQLEEFAADTLQFDEKGHLPTRAVYDAYHQWALATGHRAMASERFREAFIIFLRRKTGHADPVYKSHGVRSYRSIRKRRDDDREARLAPVTEPERVKVQTGDWMDEWMGPTNGRPNRGTA